METQRLLIQLADSSYAEDLIDYYNSDFVQEYNVMPIMTLEEYKESLNVEDPNHIQYHIIEKKSGRAIGNISLSKDSMRRLANSITLSYWLGKDYTGKGYIQEALTELIDFLFTNTDYTCISARVFADNLNSSKLIRKLGFEQEGYLKHAVRDLKGIVHDDILFALFK